MSTNRSSVALTVVAVDPPFGVEHNVLFGLQIRKVVEDFEPAAETTSFQCSFEAQREGPSVDFKGPYIHGKKGDRFIYLSWGTPGPDEPFVMFARAKLKLDDIPGGLIDAAAGGEVQLVCELQATNHKGQPASGTIKPPAVLWRLAD